MADFILLMRADSTSAVVEADWAPYLEKLGTLDALRGGSAIGGGECRRRAGEPAALSSDIVGFVRIEADNLEQVRNLLDGNPVYESGGTIEIRELPRTS